MIINLTDEQFSNLKIFLSRAELKGHEVAAFQDLANALINPPVEEKIIGNPTK